MRLLIDEDLSPQVAQRLQGDGVDAVHVRDRGRLGMSDHAILELAFDEDRILVTANVGDFERLAPSRELHGGIVLVMEGQLSRDEQIDIVTRAVAAIDEEEVAGRDMVNRVLWIGDGQLEISDLPAVEPPGAD